MNTIELPLMKVIEPGDQDFGVPMASLVDIHSRGVDSQWMTKRAASAGVFEGLDIKPRKDHSVVHLIAMGDADYYGANRNGDIFYKTAKVLDIPEPWDGVTNQVQIHCGNVERHHTFEKFAHVYQHHKNKDPKRSFGDVLKSAHNDRMSRVELLVELPNAKWERDLEKLASGDPLSFSMACRVPYDVCTYCGHKAKTKKQYCDHAKHQMTQILKCGHQVGVANDFATFFDISKVLVNADRIAYGLLKAAGLAAAAMPSAFLAEAYNLFPPDIPDVGSILGAEKLAAIKKLSEIEKEIEARTAPSAECAAIPPDLPEDAMEALQGLMSEQKSDMFGALSDAKISLSLKDFMKILMGKERFGSVAPAVEEASGCMPGMFSRALENPFDGSLSEDLEMGDGLLPRRIRDLIGQLAPSHSLADEPSRRRVQVTIIRGGSPKEAHLVKPAGVTATMGDSGLSQRIAEAYGRYKLAFLQRNGGTENRALTGLALLQHY